jgi:hypothetical protein
MVHGSTTHASVAPITVTRPDFSAGKRIGWLDYRKGVRRLAKCDSGNAENREPVRIDCRPNFSPKNSRNDIPHMLSSLMEATIPMHAIFSPHISGQVPEIHLAPEPDAGFLG